MLATPISFDTRDVRPVSYNCKVTYLPTAWTAPCPKTLQLTHPTVLANKIEDGKKQNKTKHKTS